MGALSIYLPTFAGDYAGVCSVLYDFNCLIILCDANCCTKNYIDYDEPRWSRDKTTTLCAQLRTMEVTLGDDRRILRQTAEAARALRPDFIALLGSPVPAIVGMDMDGMAREVEAQTGIPALGFDTTGFSSYRRGVELALLSLFRRFADREAPKVPRSVNLLGVTPLDFGATGNAEALRAAVVRAGFTPLCSFAMDCTLDQVRRSPGAAVNLVVSAAGLPLAREMARVWGVPYVAAVPVGGDGPRRIGALLERALSSDISQLPADRPPESDRPGILLVGDQITAHSIRLALRGMGERRAIHVGSFFGLDPALAAPGDLRLDREADLIRALGGGRYAALIGDPLLARIPGTAPDLLPLPHPAVSGPLHWDEVPLLTGGEMSRLLLRAISPRKEDWNEI